MYNNYFQLFDIAIGFALDKHLLKKKYYQLSKQYHPDYYESNSNISETENLHLSSKVNEGYILLQNEYATIGYILQLQGIITVDEKFVLPNDFLMEMMELNETLTANDIALLNQWQSTIKQPIEHLLTLHTIDGLSQNDWQQLKVYYYKEKYIQRLINRVKGIAVEL